MTEEHHERLSEQSRAGYPRIRKAAHVGAFFFSAGVQSALERVLVERPRAPSWFDHVMEEQSEVAFCRQTLVELSKRDLKLPAPPLLRAWRYICQLAPKRRRRTAVD